MIDERRRSGREDGECNGMCVMSDSDKRALWPAADLYLCGKRGEASPCDVSV